MLRVLVAGEQREYEEGTLLKTVAEEFQPRFPYDILLAMVDGKLQELHKKVKDKTEVGFITLADRPGMQAYQRSAIMLLLKAFYEVVGEEHIDKIKVEFSVGNGLYLTPRGDFSLTQELLEVIEGKMREYVAAKIPIMKRSISTQKAIVLFHNYRMYDKERLFHYRRSSRVNIYSIGGFEDYFYGYMVQNTGYIRQFQLQQYHEGLLLMMPDPPELGKAAWRGQREKLFSTLRESADWGRRLKVSNVGALNDMIVAGKMNDMILIQEALMEKKIGDIAEMIASAPEKKIVLIAGPSSSGKTTFAHRLSLQLRAKGLTPHPVSVDNYFLPRRETPRDEDGNYNFESLSAINVERFNRDMKKLLRGGEIRLPRYNFITGESEESGGCLRLEKEDILVIEGIHCLNEQLSYSLPKESKFRIYISALTQISLDEHNRVSSTDGRLLRRMVRDARTRGSTAQNTLRMWPSVRRGEEENIFPYQENADVMFNSALVYELPVLKQYAEPLLFGVPRGSREYVEAKRLQKFLEYFLGVSSEDVPHNSIIREFIGGSCFERIE